MPTTSIKRSDFSSRFRRSFVKLPPPVQDKVVAKISLFEANPNHPSLRTHKLKGELSDLWSFYVDRRYRVLFEFLNGDEVTYYDIGTHEVYR